MDKTIDAILRKGWTTNAEVAEQVVKQVLENLVKTLDENKRWYTIDMVDLFVQVKNIETGVES